MFLTKSSRATWLILISIIAYWLFAYNLIRTDYTKLLLLYTSLFLVFYQLTKTLQNQPKVLSVLGIAFRLIFIFAIPNLSQDFYRFIWDGRLVAEGLNPYLQTVHGFIDNPLFTMPQAQELLAGMGSLNASHFSNYPPVNQLCFAIAGYVSNSHILGAVVTMRLLIIGADIGTLYFGQKILAILQLPRHAIFYFFLNPFVIIELTGNLHFEALMIFFLIWSLYLFLKGQWAWAGVVLAVSASVKLLPLIFLPMFVQKFLYDHNSGKIKFTGKGIRQLLLFYTIVLGVFSLLFMPFYSSKFITNYSQTLALWFQNFEFNASFYYLFRAVGYQFRGYNEIAIIGKIIPVIVVLFITFLAFFRNNRTPQALITAMLLGLSFYFFTSTTVHPWYISTLLALSVFSSYRFPLAWSFVIIFSYLSYLHLNSANKSENLWIIALEYMIVYTALAYDLWRQAKPANKNLFKHGNNA